METWKNWNGNMRAVKLRRIDAVCSDRMVEWKHRELKHGEWGNGEWEHGEWGMGN